MKSTNNMEKKYEKKKKELASKAKMGKKLYNIKDRKRPEPMSEKFKRGVKTNTNPI